jgi:hypothetical protein
MRRTPWRTNSVMTFFSAPTSVAPSRLVVPGRWLPPPDFWWDL